MSAKMQHKRTWRQRDGDGLRRTAVEGDYDFQRRSQSQIWLQSAPPPIITLDGIGVFWSMISGVFFAPVSHFRTFSPLEDSPPPPSSGVVENAPPPHFTVVSINVVDGDPHCTIKSVKQNLRIIVLMFFVWRTDPLGTDCSNESRCLWFFILNAWCIIFHSPPPKQHYLLNINTFEKSQNYFRT